MPTSRHVVARCLTAMLAIAGTTSPYCVPAQIGLPTPAPSAAPANIDPATPDERAQMGRLLAEPIAATNDSSYSGPRSEVRQAMAACENARQDTNRDSICRDAQARYDACQVLIDGWNTRRMSLLEAIDARTPGVGQTWQGSRIRGVPTSLAVQWNDRVRMLRSFQLTTCPAFLPNSFKTPMAALTIWNAEDNAKSDPKAAKSKAEADYTESLFLDSTLHYDPDAAARLKAQQEQDAAEIARLAQRNKERSDAFMTNMWTAFGTAAASSTTSSTGSSSTAAQIAQSLGGTGQTSAAQIAQGLGGTGQAPFANSTNAGGATSGGSYGGSGGGSSGSIGSVSPATSSGPGGSPVTAGGAACVPKPTLVRTTPGGGNVPTYMRYDFTFTNGCEDIVVTLGGFKNNAEEDVVVKKGVVTKYFCTDGFLGNNDCPGGGIYIKSQRYRY